MATRSSEMAVRTRDKVVSDPDILGGVPVIRGTRVPIYVILENLEAGHTIDRILRDYPSLTRGSVREAIHYAAELCGAT
jgi:uncharacterized protein (DUF433 family)